MSNGSQKVIRLPRAPEGGKSSIADEGTRRQRLAAILEQLVQRDVIPRLMSTGFAPGGPDLIVPPAPAPKPSHAPSQEAIAFAGTLLKGARSDADAIVARLRGSGVAAETISLHLLTGAARHLGDLWSADLASFADVTLATDHLQQIFRDLAPALEVAPASPLPASAALLLATPGEQHSFGLSMLAAFFRRAGWTAQCPKVRNAVDVQRRVAATPFGLLGFSLGAEVHLTRLARCIEVARRSSCNRDLVIMVGGPVFNDRPELAVLVGADATASDAASAIATAERLVRTGHD